MTLTHWFLMFGGLTILAIAIDGIRRMVSKPTTLAIDLDETLQNLVQEDYGAELPNGGARVVGAEKVARPVVTAAIAEEVVAEEEVAEKVVAEEVVAEEVVAEEVVAEEVVAEEVVAEEVVAEEVVAEEVVAEEVVAEEVVAEEVVAEESAFDAEQSAEELQVESLATESELELELAPELSLDDFSDAVMLQDELADAAVNEDSLVATDTDALATEQAPEFDLAAPEAVDTEQQEQPETNPLVAAFDPTRPVHEVVESHKMVQSDMFAEMEAPIEAEQVEPDRVEDWQEYAAIEEIEEAHAHPSEEGQDLSEVEDILSQAQDDTHPRHSDASQNLSQDKEILNQAHDDELAQAELAQAEVSTKADDILLTDTGLEDDEPQGQSLLAKVTSFTLGRKMLEARRKQAEEAQALEELSQAEDSVVANIEQVLTIIVAAKDAQGFYGHNLKTLAQACGMVHGSMGLFHRHEDGLTEGSTQFSMANMTESGAFDMATMDNIHTAGVVFFMTLPSANDGMRAFDYMVETAQCLANNLGGELYDDSRSVLRAQTVEHYRQRIREFERQRLARRAHVGV